MISPVDFDEVKRLVTVWDVLTINGWVPTSVEPASKRGPCPLHGSESRNSRSFSAAEHGWTCWVCKRSGDSVRLWAELRQVSMLDAALEMCRRARVAVPRKRTGHGKG